jgi:hypothetical protein
LTKGATFFIAALDAGHARLYCCTPTKVTTCRVADLPTGVAAIRSETEFQRMLYSNPGARPHNRSTTEIGRVDGLLTAKNVVLWGRFGPGDRPPTSHGTPVAGDDDLLNKAAIHTLEHGGVALNLPQSELPRGALAAAAFLYAIRWIMDRQVGCVSFTDCRLL